MKLAAAGGVTALSALLLDLASLAGFARAPPRPIVSEITCGSSTNTPLQTHRDPLH